MRELAAVLDELVINAPVEALDWTDVEARSNPKRSRRSQRRRLLVALALFATLVVTGAAVAVGVTLLNQEQRLYQDDGQAHPPQRLGPLVQITSGENWALIAWQTNIGICLDFAIPGNSTYGCAFSVRDATPATNPSPTHDPSVHAIAAQVSGATLVGGDGKTTIFGIAAPGVATMTIELNDGRTLKPPLHPARPELNTDARFFIARTYVTHPSSTPDLDDRPYGPDQPLPTNRDVLAYSAYDTNGNLIERVTG